MSISAFYDFHEDRMKLNIRIELNTIQPFWFNRAQWLNLIVIMQKHNLKKSKAIPQKNKSNNKKDGTIEPTILNTLLVKNIRFKLVEDAIKLAIVSFDKKIISITISQNDSDRFNTMLLDLAERAGWDPFPALKRLKSYEDSQNAIKKARYKNNYH